MDAELLGQFFAVKQKLEDKGFGIRTDDDAFKVLKGDKVVFVSDEPLDIEEWLEVMT